MTAKINLAEKFEHVPDPWVPKVVGALNGQLVKIARAEGAYVWHRHEGEDELFLVLEGRLAIHLRTEVVELAAGECFIVPRGVEHKPVAEPGTRLLLFEPASTRNTGDLDHAYTIEPDALERI
ncbi:MAG: cupin domain-containing protein [Phycisphaerales bacterium]|nr:cupin domain-containing protein [Phycisphaerales bacterium]